MTEAAVPKKTRRRRAPSDILVDSVLSMPLGDLIKFATAIAAKDQETARFLQGRLSMALQGTPFVHGTSIRGGAEGGE